MNLLNNPYDEVMNPELDFSAGYFDAVVNSVVNRGLLVEMLKSGKADVEGSVDFLWGFLPIDQNSNSAVTKFRPKTFFGILSTKHKN